MTRYLTGLIAAAGLTLGTASNVQAQVPVNVGVAQVAYARTNYVVTPVAHHGYARHHHRGYGYGYAPRAYVAPRFYGGFVPRHHHRHHRHCGHYGYGW